MSGLVKSGCAVRAAAQTDLERNANRAYLRAKLIEFCARAEQSHRDPDLRRCSFIGSLIGESELPTHERERIEAVLYSGTQS